MGHTRGSWIRKARGNRVSIARVGIPGVEVYPQLRTWFGVVDGEPPASINPAIAQGVSTTRSTLIWSSVLARGFVGLSDGRTLLVGDEAFLPSVICGSPDNESAEWPSLLELSHGQGRSWCIAAGYILG